jgi:hypothetical protein
MLVPFSYIVFDNSPNDTMAQSVKDRCTYLNINYYRVPQNDITSSNGSLRVGQSLNYAIKYVYNTLSYRGICMICDSDLFLIDKFNPVEVLADNDYVGRNMKNIYMVNEPNNPLITHNYIYYVNQFAIVNFGRNIDPLCLDYTLGRDGHIDYDCGGKLRNYFLNSSIKHTPIDDIPSQYFSEDNISECPDIMKEYMINDVKLMPNKKGFSEIFGGKFLHFRGGGNWMGHSDVLVRNREDNLYTFLCNRLIDWNIDISDRSNKYLICYSLYGNNPKYTHNMIINAQLAKKIYNGWTVRVYYDDTVGRDIIDKLSEFDNVELIRAEPLCRNQGHERMMWRFYPVNEDGVRAIISRDADSWLSFREAYLVNEWLSSSKSAHIIRDHCYHSQKIMGGMFGLKYNAVDNIVSKIVEYTRRNTYDQGFLAEIVYPHVINDALVHTNTNQRDRSGNVTPGYFNDGCIPFIEYPKIRNYLPDVDIEHINNINSFKCLHCGSVHTFFIGEMFSNLPQSVKYYIN